MGRLIVVADDVVGNEEIRSLLETYGYRVQSIRASDDMSVLNGSLAAAVMIAVNDLGNAAAGRASALRKGGFKGVIVAVGMPTPEVSVRQRLAELAVWYVPALSGPGDAVSRIRQLLP
jgi:hypothetical protein